MTLRTRWKPTDRFLVRHKDAAILVVEKKAGLLTVRTESGRAPDLLSLLGAFVGIHGRGRGESVFAVHRLDRVVSGLLVFARRRDARQHLIDQFRRHSVERRYIAAVSGLLAEDRGTFKSRLVTDHPSLKVYSDDDQDDATASGRPAITHWRVIERFERARATLVEVQLETGIRNQIRVHFADAAHPLLGEWKYRPDQEEEPGGQGTRRIFLHAAVLGFVHPSTGAAMRFEAPLPPDLARWREALARARPAPRSPSGRGSRPRAARTARHRGQRSRKKR